MSGLEPTAERTPRQRELMVVAARLFALRGYRAVGINDISGELGLTGPAFYRHYQSKEALLIAVLDDAISSHLEQVGDLMSSISDPLETLAAIVAHHLDFVFEQAETLTIWRTEFRTLPDSDRHRLSYLQRLYTEEWVRTLRQIRPDLDLEQIRGMCHAAVGLLQSPIEFPNRLNRDDLTPILTAMAMESLLSTRVTSVITAPGR